LKNRVAAVTLLILMVVSFLLMPLALVLGQLGMNIFLVSPEEEGVIGQAVNVQGTIETQNSAYEIWFANKLVASNISEGYYVNANFTIPQLSGGAYTIILRDVSRRVNATHPFNVKVSNTIQALDPSPPAQLQEGSNVVLNVTFTGVQSGTAYFANVTVELPAPLSTSYSETKKMLMIK